eukprot:UN02147
MHWNIVQIRFACTGNFLVLLVIGLSVCIVGVIVGVIFLIYACVHRRVIVRMHLDFGIPKNEDNLDVQLDFGMPKQEDNLAQLDEFNVSPPPRAQARVESGIIYIPDDHDELKTPSSHAEQQINVELQHVPQETVIYKQDVESSVPSVHVPEGTIYEENEINIESEHVAQETIYTQEDEVKIQTQHEPQETIFERV